MIENNILDVQKLTKKYISKNGIETLALNQVSFGVNKNEMVAIMGSSGSGKSTLINILTGLMKPDEGFVYVNGQDYFSLPINARADFRRKNIGIVFQNYNLIDSLTVDENIRVPLILDNQMDDQKDRAEAVALSLGIQNELKKYPYEISGGQQQRVGICRAIVNDPSIIFADEPTGNLDSKFTEQVMESFVKACGEKAASLLMVTHDAKAASYCDRVLFLCDGQIKKEVCKEKSDNNQFYICILEAQKAVLE